MTTAKDIRISDIGRTARSLVYPNKNKTAKPSPIGVRDATGRLVWAREPRKYVIESIYAHANGNILINGSIYLRPDTDIEFLETESNEND